MHGHTHTHTRSCTHTHTHTHTRPYTHTRSHTHTVMHTRPCTRTHTHTHTHVHTRTHTRRSAHPFTNQHSRWAARSKGSRQGSGRWRNLLGWRDHRDAQRPAVQVIPLHEALSRAKDEGLDLVEVSTRLHCRMLCGCSLRQQTSLCSRWPVLRGRMPRWFGSWTTRGGSLSSGRR